jgi:hypothetical protein
LSQLPGKAPDFLASTPLLSATSLVFLLEVVVFLVFALETLLRMLADTRQLFFSPWNCFELAIVLGAGVALVLQDSSWAIRACMIEAFRVLSNLQGFAPEVSQKASRSLGMLKHALSMMAKRTVLIVAVFALEIAVFAWLGLWLFKATDAAHFGTFLRSMFTLIRCVSLDRWYDVMLINVLGCRDHALSLNLLGTNCAQSRSGWGWIAVSYFIALILLVTLPVVGTLFSSATMAFNTARRSEQRVWMTVNRIVALKRLRGIPSSAVDHFKKVFDSELDMASTGTISLPELKSAIRAHDANACAQEIHGIYGLLDAQKAGEVDFGDFLTFICDAHDSVNYSAFVDLRNGEPKRAVAHLEAQRIRREAETPEEDEVKYCDQVFINYPTNTGDTAEAIEQLRTVRELKNLGQDLTAKVSIATEELASLKKELAAQGLEHVCAQEFGYAGAKAQLEQVQNMQKPRSTLLMSKLNASREVSRLKSILQARESSDIALRDQLAQAEAKLLGVEHHPQLATKSSVKVTPVGGISAADARSEGGLLVTVPDSDAGDESSSPVHAFEREHNPTSLVDRDEACSTVVAFDDEPPWERMSSSQKPSAAEQPKKAPDLDNSLALVEVDFV